MVNTLLEAAAARMREGLLVEFVGLLQRPDLVTPPGGARKRRAPGPSGWKLG